jgi:hypothetical protein
MRAIIIVSIFVLTMDSFGQLGDQFPDSGAVWKETYWWQPSPFFYNGIGETYLEGDTVFNDTTYQKIYNLRRDVFCSDIIISGPEYSGALRGDSITNKVYARWNANTNENLLYDYTLQVGDTLPLNIAGWVWDIGVYVTRIDTIQTLDGINRKVWYLDFKYEPFEGWPQIVEGIGSTSGLFGGIEPYWEGWNELLCFSVNGNEVWRSLRDTCYVITDSCANVGVNERNNDEINIYPNPFQNYFRILNIPLNTKTNISLISSYGQIIFNQDLGSSISELKLETEYLQTGFYVLTIRTSDNKIIRKKIIKN